MFRQLIVNARSAGSARKILLSLIVIAAVSAAVVKGTQALFSDTETSNDNTFAASSLDLTVGSTTNGQNTVKFTVANMKPTDAQTGTYTLNNIGSLAGYLDLESISITNNENSRLEPEIQAGDTTDGAGELQTLVNLEIFVDTNNNGVKDGTETDIYNGKAGSIAANYDVSQSIDAGATTYLTVIADWPSQVNDNQAMGDDMTVNMTFELGQTTGQ
ncbi:MAG: hypothetical protein UV54_C0053G0008 [Candidatus Beckwithbacteria bacterium GW2011_GWA2_43_10]|uniref:Uncharacterized protein n=1 Tax=Candidatus Beckwithbacteria bacterium GW2011_GWA2_43_10 TaxID=1618369 RepID=A0A0G1EVX4_9BACT|nr:MAG: hypothetical protein UV54_C0053G0008 [Candidatus Beckwithbacteria bacterium GW2011_GWA2_43_10]